MTIREIAQKAGVSISTVSKVVNGKDKDINRETRERVLNVVKQYNYRPYGDTLAQQSARQFLLGVILKKLADYPEMVDSLIRRAMERGYRVIVCESDGDAEREREHVLQLCKHQVDCVLWEPVSMESGELEAHFEKRGIPIVFIGNGRGNLQVNVQAAAEAAAERLIEKGHTSIACLARKSDIHAEAFFEGYKKALFRHNLPHPTELIFRLNDSVIDDGVFFSGATAVLCFRTSLSALFFKTAYEKNLTIPGDLSLLTVCATSSQARQAQISSFVRIPYAEFGKFVCDTAINRVEGLTEGPEEFSPVFEYCDTGSVDVPLRVYQQKIVIVGNINLDIVLKVDDLPMLGKTVLVKGSDTIPGGKGANQAVGAARLGANSMLLGRVGYDLEGKNILQYLTENHVNVEHVIQDKRKETGKAYVYVRQDSESGIAIYPGANANLSAKDIKSRRHCFERARCCLIQTEIPMEAALEAARIAREEGVTTLLKPSAVSEITPELLTYIDILVPNRTECTLLAPSHCRDMSEQAQFFLAQGVKTVIVTAGAQGSYVYSVDKELHIRATPCKAVDATGASDAFIAALAVALLENHDIEQAVRYANTAAGISTTQSGAMPSLPDAKTVQRYLETLE